MLASVLPLLAKFTRHYAVGDEGARPSEPPPKSRHREERLRKRRHKTNAATPTAARQVRAVADIILRVDEPPLVREVKYR